MKLKMDQLLILILVTGFFVGIFYINKMGISRKIFDDALVRTWVNHKTDYKEYLLYIIKERVGVLVLVLFLSNVRWKQVYGGVLSFVAATAGGAVFAMAIKQAGIRGGINCVVCLLPHSVFYTFVYLIFVNYWLKSGRWNWAKTAGVVVFMLLGILSEVYVNPSWIKFYMFLYDKLKFVGEVFMAAP